METNTEKNLSRRKFLGDAAKGVAALTALPTILTSASGWKGANDKITVAHIGVGSRGTGELKSYFLPVKSAVNIAVCDVYKDRRESAALLINKYYKDNNLPSVNCRDYLEMDEIFERKDIDAVHITTPDHWHVLAAIKAARAGKHIYLAKPLGLSYPEYLVLTREIKKSGVRFHYGTQQRSFDHMKLGYDLIRDGEIGQVLHVDVWSPGKNEVPNPVCNRVPVPADFDFERWTGPAPLLDYCPDRVTNNSSWFQYIYSIGFLAGWGAHPIDILVWILKESVSGKYSGRGTGQYWPKGGIYDNILSWDVSYKCINGPEVHFMSTDVAVAGMLNHREIKEGNGTTFYGSKGWISLSRSSAQSDLPSINEKLNNFPKNEAGNIKSENNSMASIFIDIVKGTRKELCPLDEAIISDTISHMGDIAIRTNREVHWDPKIGKVVDDKEANDLYVREMRKPFKP